MTNNDDSSGSSSNNNNNKDDNACGGPTQRISFSASGQLFWLEKNSAGQ